ncbi:MAG: HAMP domain-containing sensor histidine kinase [Spongiibacteraceae bacterium]
MEKDQTIDFSMLLASSVHDIKNSLSVLLTSLDAVIDDGDIHNDKQKQNHQVLRDQASQINNTLIHLLGLYRLQNNQLFLNLDQVFIADFLAEQVEQQKLLLDIHNVSASIECDDDLSGYFDENLIAGVINNILINCAKYAKTRIVLSAEQKGPYLHINITDDGDGYPQAIIKHLSNHHRSIDFNSGSTNLGLFFSQKIAALHRCKDRQGSILLSNLPEGGGCFSLLLP